MSKKLTHRYLMIYNQLVWTDRRGENMMNISPEWILTVWYTCRKKISWTPKKKIEGPKPLPMRAKLSVASRRKEEEEKFSLKPPVLLGFYRFILDVE